MKLRVYSGIKNYKAFNRIVEENIYNSIRNAKNHGKYFCILNEIFNKMINELENNHERYNNKSFECYNILLNAIIEGPEKVKLWILAFFTSKEKPLISPITDKVSIYQLASLTKSPNSILTTTISLKFISSQRYSIKFFDDILYIICDLLLSLDFYNSLICNSFLGLIKKFDNYSLFYNKFTDDINLNGKKTILKDLIYKLTIENFEKFNFLICFFEFNI